MTIPNRVRSGLRIPMELNTKLILIAQKKGWSKNTLIVEILQRWVDTTASTQESRPVGRHGEGNGLVEGKGLNYLFIDEAQEFR